MLHSIDGLFPIDGYLDQMSGISRSENAQLFLYVATKTFDLKVVSLRHLTSDKVEKWGKSERFVVVVKKVDGTVLAYAQALVAEGLQKQPNLNIDGHSVKVNALTDSDYKCLSFVGDLLKTKVTEESKEMESDKKKKSDALKKPLRQPMTSEKSLTGDKTVAFLISSALMAELENAPGKLIQSMLDQFAKEREAEKERMKEDAEKKEILTDAIKKEVLTHEIRHTEVLKQEIENTER